MSKQIQDSPRLLEQGQLVDYKGVKPGWNCNKKHIGLVFNSGKPRGQRGVQRSSASGVFQTGLQRDGQAAHQNGTIYLWRNKGDGKNARANSVQTKKQASSAQVQ